MQYSTILLALATAASALDIRLFGNNQCGGAYSACVNMNPTTCCSHHNSARHPGIAFAAIPTNWNLQLRGWTNGGCGALAVSANTVGNPHYCLKDPSPVLNTAFSGGGYKFNSRKRADPSTEQCDINAASACESVTAPSIFVLEDETTYAIADMPEPLLNELVRLLPS